MKGIKLLLALLIATWSINLNAQQSVLPQLKDNPAARDLIQREIYTLELVIKQNSPSHEWDRKLDLYQTAIMFLNEATVNKPTTQYALTSAFLNNEVKWENITDALALLRFNHKQWPKEFQELINLVKI
jgi:hypothetical protein